MAGIILWMFLCSWGGLLLKFKYWTTCVSPNILDEVRVLSIGADVVVASGYFPFFFLFSCICWLVFWAVCSLFSAFTLAERSVKNGISSDHILEFIFSSLSHFSAEKKINMLLAVTMTESLCKWQGQWLVSAMRSLLAYSWFVGQKKPTVTYKEGIQSCQSQQTADPMMQLF